MPPKEAVIMESKQWRLDLDGVLQRMKHGLITSRERSLAITKLQEAIMWLGMDLKQLNDGVSCYKHGYDPSSPIVDSPPDGVKL